MITVEQLVSIDGFAAERDGGLRFVEATHPGVEPPDRGQLELLASVGAIVLGRRTYEMFAGCWPMVDPATEPVAEPIARLPKLVVSATLDRAPWGDGEIEVVRPRPSAVEAVREVARRHGSVIVWGSLMLTDALLAAGAVDRLRLRTCPALVGAGRRLAPSDLGMRLMRLGSVEALPTGHVVSEYLPDPVRR